MTHSEAIRTIMAKKGIRTGQAAARLDMPCNKFVGRIDYQTINIKKLNEVLRVLDYKLVVVPSDTRLKEGEYEIE